MEADGRVALDLSFSRRSDHGAWAPGSGSVSVAIIPDATVPWSVFEFAMGCATRGSAKRLR